MSFGIKQKLLQEVGLHWWIKPKDACSLEQTVSSPQEMLRTLVSRWQHRLKSRKQRPSMMWTECSGMSKNSSGRQTKWLLHNLTFRNFECGAAHHPSKSLNHPTSNLQPSTSRPCVMSWSLNCPGEDKSLKSSYKPWILFTYLISAQMKSLTFGVGVCPLGGPSYYVPP